MPTNIPNNFVNEFDIKLTYALGQKVVFKGDGFIYESTENNNKGNQPNTSPFWWMNTNEKSPVLDDDYFNALGISAKNHDDKIAASEEKIVVIDGKITNLEETVEGLGDTSKETSEAIESLEDKIKLKADNFTYTKSNKLFQLTSNNVPIGNSTEIGGSDGKRSATLVVASTTAGYKIDDCDFLCDGLNDEVEINQALAKACSNGTVGGKILLLDGLYNISSSINITGSSVTLEGMGKSTLLRRQFNGNLINISTTGEWAEIKNMRIDGYRAVYNSTSNVEIMSGAMTVTIENNIIENCGGIAIKFNKPLNFVIRNNIIENCASYGIYSESQGIVQIIGNYMKTMQSSGTSIYGIRIGKERAGSWTNDENVHIVNNFIYGFSNGIKVGGFCNVSITNNDIVGSWNSDARGIYVDNGAAEISCNHIEYGYPIYVDRIYRASIANNKLNGRTVYVKETYGVIIASNMSDGIQGYPAINLANDCRYCVVMGNHTNTSITNSGGSTNIVLNNSLFL